MTSYLQQRTLFAPQISARPSLNLGIVVVIPAHDEPYLLLSLMNLEKCRLPDCDIEIIVVINNSEAASPALKTKNLEIGRQVTEWARKHSKPRRRYHVLFQLDLPHKHAGVGLARKIGMDEACWRFEKMGKTDGIIACFDADTRCQENYFEALEAHFRQYPESPACSIYYEHPLEGVSFEPEVYQAITLYELHLRYYINAQRYAGFPFAYQTIGSSMAVRSDAYQQQGGMNRRKAGEDFYFLQKFIQLGRFTELNTTCLCPSPRPSQRVPFGTGRAVGEVLKGKMAYATYAPESFQDLKVFFELVRQSYQYPAEKVLAAIPESMTSFLLTINFSEKWEELHHHTASEESFQQRFFQWFNAFQLMKYLHFCRDTYYPNVPVAGAAAWLLREMGLEHAGTAREQLCWFRKFDRKKEV